jgi:CO/xanthine dehydrogenase Mo-binding subunit
LLETETRREGRKKWIGTPAKRKEDPALLTGSQIFVDDIELRGMLHASVVRSLLPHARIKSVDCSKALAASGVMCVLTGEDATGLMNPMEAYIAPAIKEYPIAVAKVAYVGQPLAVVVATTKALAEDAKELVEVDYEPLPFVLDADEATKKDAPLVIEELGTNVIWQNKYSFGDAEGALKGADLVIDETFTVPRHSSTPLETRGVIANFNAATGFLTVWSNFQLPGRFFATLSKILRVPGHKLRLITPSIGGGFGNRAATLRYMIPLICMASMKAGRPVKYVESRGESFLAGQTCLSKLQVRAAVTKDGIFTGMNIKDVENEGGGLNYVGYFVRNKLQALTGCYQIKNITLDGWCIATNQVPSEADRGVGKPALCFAWERVMDIAARKLGLDPAEIRMRNFVKRDQFPYRTPNGNLYENGDYEGALRRALDLIGYESFRREQAELRERGRYLGVGISTCVEPGGINMSLHNLDEPVPTKSGASEAATVRIDVTGKATVLLSHPDVGGGHDTSAAQIVADEIGMDYEDVTIIHSFDSALFPWTGYSGLSGNGYTPVLVPAIVGAARELRAKIVKVAAHMLKESEENLEIEDSVVFLKTDRSRFVQIKQIAWLVYNQPLLLPQNAEAGLQVTYFSNARNADLPDSLGRVRAQLTYPNGVHVVTLEVDKETGQVKILRYVVVGDYGTIVNPAVVEGQIQGNTVHGLAVALSEAFSYGEDGQPLTTSFADYPKPTACEAPVIEAHHMETPTSTNPIGAKSVGEGGAILSPAAVANAVEDALSPMNAQVRDLPLDLIRVWALANGRQVLSSRDRSS